MLDSRLVKEFERETGEQIIKCIELGIANGNISKYLASFCPLKLPSVPLTSDKKSLSLAQADPIKAVQSAIVSNDWLGLIDLFVVHEVREFTDFMDSKPKGGDYIYKGQVEALIKEMRVNPFKPGDREIIIAFTQKWNDGLQCSAQYGNLGRVRWEAPNLTDIYMAYKQKLDADNLGFTTDD